MAGTSHILIGNRTYTVVDDTTIIYQALITGMVKNGLTGEPLQTDFTIRVEREDIDVKTLVGGLFCLAGYAKQVFPNLNTTNYQVDLLITASGYHEVRQTVPVPQNAVLPINLSIIQLQWLPVRIQGRVSKEAGNHPPIPNAKIVSVDGPGSPPAEHAVILRTPLHSDHATGAVRGRQLTSVALPAPPKQLVLPAWAGNRTLTVNNRQSLAVNHILRLGPDLWGEYGVIESIAAIPANLTQPGEVTLRSALNHSFPAGTTFEVFTLGAAIGPARHLVSAAAAGDGLLILDGLLAADIIEITDPPRPVEYHALGALTDAEGYYQLNGIGRVRTVYLQASAAGFATPPDPVSWMINYEQPVNLVDFRL